MQLWDVPKSKSISFKADIGKLCGQLLKLDGNVGSERLGISANVDFSCSRLCHLFFGQSSSV